MFPVLVALKVGTVPLIGFPFTSSSVIVIAEVEVPFGSIGPVPVIVEVVLLGGPAVKVTVFPLKLTGEVSKTVFTSA